MAIDADRMQKPVRKLRKLLKKMPRQSPAEDVHDLRTNSRRLEAAFQALSLDAGRNGRKVLKKVGKLRKRAGKVRDMDVQTGYLSTLHVPASERECMVQLLEYLGAQRDKHAKKLDAVRRWYGSSLGKRLKRSSRDIDKTLPQNGDRSADGNAIDAEAAGSALRLIAEQLASLSLASETAAESFADGAKDRAAGFRRHSRKGKGRDWRVARLGRTYSYGTGDSRPRQKLPITSGIETDQ